MTGLTYTAEILESTLKVLIESMGMEVEDVEVIEDLDPKHAMRCKISKQTAE
jgi:hypothetical protein